MTTDARCALNGEADDDGIVGFGGNIDILASHIGRTVVVEGEQVDFVRHHGSWYHVVKREEGALRCELGDFWARTCTCQRVRTVEGQRGAEGLWGNTEVGGRDKHK